jgi:hypothetical protein
VLLFRPYLSVLFFLPFLIVIPEICYNSAATVQPDDDELMLGLLHNFHRQHRPLSSSFVEYALRVQSAVLEALYLHE